MHLMSLLIKPAIAIVNQQLFDASYPNGRASETYQRLVGNTLKLTFKELPEPVVLRFEKQKIRLIDDEQLFADCSLTASLKELMIAYRQGTLINLVNHPDQQQSITIDGDINVLQLVISLCECLEWQTETLLAPYIGDIAAYSLGQAMGGVTRLTQRILDRNQQRFSEALTEEWRLAPGHLEVICFYDEIAFLAEDIKRLECRVKELELT